MNIGLLFPIMKALGVRNQSLKRKKLMKVHMPKHFYLFKNKPPKPDFLLKKWNAFIVRKKDTSKETVKNLQSQKSSITKVPFPSPAMSLTGTFFLDFLMR